MKVKANVVIEITGEDFVDMDEDMGEVLQLRLKQEVEEAIMASEVWRDLKRTVYHAVLDKLREEVAKEFIDKIKGEHNG
jgi:hypothetical protein